MRCPHCGNNDTKVTDSRESDEGIRRRRECLACGKRFTTYERVQAAPLMVVKKDGRREEFSRDKVFAGIRRSCAKLPISMAEINALVDDIESSLAALGTAEVSSVDLGDIIMDRLKELSHVAYVRFAAHYREFRDKDEIEQLERELDALKTGPRRSPRRAGATQPSLLPPIVVDTPIAAEARPRRRARL